MIPVDNSLMKDEVDSAMIDLETMGVNPNAALVQVGCVLFNSRTGKLGQQYSVDVDLESSLALGGKIDKATVEWWTAQGGWSPFAKVYHIVDVLDNLAIFLNKFPTLERFWSQGATFDIAILERYYHALRRDPPWKYNQSRDTRTVYDFARQRGWDKPEGTAPEHEAIYDCIQQITCLMSAFEYLRGDRK